MGGGRVAGDLYEKLKRAVIVEEVEPCCVNSKELLPQSRQNTKWKRCFAEETASKGWRHLHSTEDMLDFLQVSILLKSVEDSKLAITIPSKAGRVFEETPTTRLPPSDLQARFFPSHRLAWWNAGSCDWDDSCQWRTAKRYYTHLTTLG